MNNAISMEFPCLYGQFRLFVWPGERGRELVALTTPTLDSKVPVYVRIHSECLTGDTFASSTCDCGLQKEHALSEMAKYKNGIFVYHRQEGRNMGLYKKVQAYNLMQRGRDTHAANIELVGHPDGREYSDVLLVLETFFRDRKPKIILLTNNPYKQLFLERYGYRVTARALKIPGTNHSVAYTDTKREKFLHDSVGHEAYVGITLMRRDLQKREEIRAVLDSVPTLGKAIYLGVSIPRESLRDTSFADEIEALHSVIGNKARIILHLDWPSSRQAYRNLRNFLGCLNFSYSIQMRDQNSTAFDMELIDALHAEKVILQIAPTQIPLLLNRDLSHYFSRPNHLLLVDNSFGLGKHDTFEQTKKNILAIINHGISRIGVAGGYSEQNVHQIRELEDYFKIPISVDAETHLREGGVISIPKMEAYLHSSTSLSSSIARTR